MKNSSILDNISPTDTISLYIAEATRTPLLTRSEEKYLMQHIERARLAAKSLETSTADKRNRKKWQKLYQMGEHARNRLITANTRLVIHIAQKYRGLGIPLNDLIQEGNIGLINAIEKFDYRRGNRFATYATWWIRQGILRALNDQSRTIRLPSYLRKQYKDIKTFIEGYEGEHGEAPSHREISLALGISEYVVGRILNAIKPTQSLNYVANDGENRELQDSIRDNAAEAVYQNVSLFELSLQLQNALTMLPSRQARILTLRYGLFGSCPHSRNEIGEKVGLNRERVRQLELDAIRKLRTGDCAKQLVEFFD